MGEVEDMSEIKAGHTDYLQPCIWADTNEITEKTFRIYSAEQLVNKSQISLVSETERNLMVVKRGPWDVFVEKGSTETVVS